MVYPWLRRGGCLLAVGLALILLGEIHAPAQEPQPLPPPRPIAPDRGTRVPAGPDILPSTYGGTLPPAIPVTLVNVLKLASLANLDIAQANLVIQRASAALLRSRAQFLPNLNFGTQYIHHEGQLQNTAGNVQEVNRDSLFNYVGPSAVLDFTSALFGPTEAAKLLDSARFGQLRVTNDTLQRVADAYFDLLRARRRLALIDESLDFLVSTQESPVRGNNTGLLPMITAFVKAGNALPSDQARVEADVVRQTEARIRALQDVRVTSAELARLLHISALVFLMPGDDYRWPLDIPGEAWFQQPIDELVGLSLRSRPELAENNALIQAAMARYRAAQWRPYLPTMGVNYAWGGFGGGPAVVGKTASGGNILGESGTIANYGTRSDFEINVLWRLQNLGVGNWAEIRDTRAAFEQQQIRQLQIQDQVMAQMVQAFEQMQRSKQRVDYTRVSLFDEKGQPTGAVYRSIRLNFIRIKGGQGVPLEVLDSVRRLSDILDSYANSLTDYDRARFRVLTALGMSPGALLDPSLMPMPPPPPGAPPAPAKPAALPAAMAPPTPGGPTRSPTVSTVSSPSADRSHDVLLPDATPPVLPLQNSSAAPVVQEQGPGPAMTPNPMPFTPTTLPSRAWRGGPGSSDH